ncbi:MAG: translation initiation factor IF-2 [Candidatus Aenigmarchaeota archaeon]|nr:translation initiation factor IF-2 [Candidatus Aenigmarchaeota archaeon]
MALRQPIVSILGHVDHGKTTLLDYIRGSIVAKGEAGRITQHIGASEVPIDYIKKMSGPLLKKMNVDVKIPGLLFIDTPGHAAFTTLRKRGGAVADIGVLIVDINEGLQPQTDESIRFLKEFKTPFVIALTKIDRLTGWFPNEGDSFLSTWNKQSKRVKDEFEKKFYAIVGQLSGHGFEVDRYDRVTDFRKKISIIPVSGITGEGIPDLLMMLTGLSQRFLEKRLHVTPGEGKGTVLEVKDYKGLGTTIDVILYDGEINTGDWLVIGVRDMLVTKVRALLKPNPMKEIRVEKAFRPVKTVTAASGIKIAAPELEKVTAGSPLRAVSDESRIEAVKKDIEEEVSEVEIDTDNAGVLLRADTLGSLEALIKTLKEIDVPIRKADIGDVSKQDVMEIKSLPNPIIFAFNVKVSQEIDTIAGDNNVKIFSSDIIYRLLEDYEKWMKDTTKRKEDSLLSGISRPGRIRIMPGYVFRQCKPAIVGVEVIKGIIRSNSRLVKDGKDIGDVKELQAEGENVSEGKAGDRLAVSIDGGIVGKNIDEGDEIDIKLMNHELDILRKLRHRLRGDELELLKELEE